MHTQKVYFICIHEIKGIFVLEVFFKLLHATTPELSKECTITSEEKKNPFITKLTGRGIEVSNRILSCVQDFKR